MTVTSVLLRKLSDTLQSLDRFLKRMRPACKYFLFQINYMNGDSRQPIRGNPS